MGDIKIGDRVHVKYDATVNGINGDGTLRLVVDEDRPGIEYGWLKPERCTVIVPPIKVGDVVTADNIDQLPPWSVVARPHGVAYTCGDGGMRWYGDVNGDIAGPDDAIGATLLRIGGSSSPSTEGEKK